MEINSIYWLLKMVVCYTSLKQTHFSSKIKPLSENVPSCMYLSFPKLDELSVQTCYKILDPGWGYAADARVWHVITLMWDWSPLATLLGLIRFALLPLEGLGSPLNGVTGTPNSDRVNSALVQVSQMNGADWSQPCSANSARPDLLRD